MISRSWESEVDKPNLSHPRLILAAQSKCSHLTAQWLVARLSPFGSRDFPWIFQWLTIVANDTLSPWIYPRCFTWIKETSTLDIVVWSLVDSRDFPWTDCLWFLIRVWEGDSVSQSGSGYGQCWETSWLSVARHWFQWSTRHSHLGRVTTNISEPWLKIINGAEV